MALLRPDHFRYTPLSLSAMYNNRKGKKFHAHMRERLSSVDLFNLPPRVFKATLDNLNLPGCLALPSFLSSHQAAANNNLLLDKARIFIVHTGTDREQWRGLNARARATADLLLLEI